jgi:hypothetical protein
MAVGTLLSKMVTLSHGKYCWKVQAVGIDPSTPPTFRKFAVSPTAPAAPVVLAPPANAITGDNTPDFTWNATISTAGAPFTYDLQSDNNGSAFPSPEINLTGLGLSHTPGSGLADGVYCWRVRTVNMFMVAGPWSVVRCVTIDTTSPAIPTQTVPPNGSSTTVNPPTLTWMAVPGAVKYNVRLDTVNPPVVEYNNLMTTSFKPPSPLLNRTYYWQVQAVDAAGNTSGWSTPAREFKITTASLAAPVLNRFAPENPAPWNLPPTLTWGPISWTNPGGYYELEVDNNNNFASPEYRRVKAEADEIPTGTQSVTISPLPNGTWYWRIRACTAANACGAWSTVGTFTVES